jgi:RNase P/RNase MRP subunit POP5
MKLKTKPSSRLNRRYLLIEAKSKQEVESTILDYIGILGWAKAVPLFIKNENNQLILAIERKELTNIRAAFEASDKKIKLLKVSGTLKGLNKK